MKLEKPLESARYLKFSLTEWDNHTIFTFNKLLDFLEFPKDRKVLLLVAKPNRNFEGYSCDHLPPEQVVSERIQKMREES